MARAGTWPGHVPEVTGSGREPMAAPLDPHRDVSDALAARPSPWVRSLDGTWDFALLDAPERLDAGGRTEGEDVSSWASMDVPSTWVLGHGGRWGRPSYTNVLMPFDLEPPAVPSDNDTGLYRTTFDVPREWADRRTLLEIGGAESFCSIWVNGEPVGHHSDSRLASTYDVTPFLVARANEVRVAVSRWSASTWLEDQDQWWLPGLFRSVRLISVPRVSLRDVVAIPGWSPESGDGHLMVSAEVDSGPRPEAGWTVSIDVHDPRGRRVGGLDTTEVPAFDRDSPLAELISGMTWAGPRVGGRIDVAGAAPWSHEDPVLHRVVAVLRSPAGDVVDVRSLRTGFRSVEIGDRELRINGEPVLIVGVNLHEFDPDRGRSVTEEGMRRDLELMKTHHVNAVRCAHAPPRPRLLELCDEIGLYVIDEANMESHARQASLTRESRWAGQILARVSRMVERDRSHPSVIAWSLGNEAGVGPAHHAAAAWVRQTDPSRPLHYEGQVMFDLHDPAELTDIVCPMYSSVEAIVAWARSELDERRPLILCEFSHAMGNAGGLADYVDAFRSTHGLQGGFIWEWCDHGIRTDPGRSEFAYGGDFGEEVHDGNFCCDGLVSPDRDPHPLLAEYAALNEPVVVRAQGRDLVVENRQWFSDLSRLRARWVHRVDGRTAARGPLSLPDVPPQRSASVPPPDIDDTRPGRHTLDVEIRPARRPEWAPPGWILGRSQMELGVVGPLPDAGSSWRRRGRIAPGIVVDGDEVSLRWGEDEVAAPDLSLWRAPTDNDGVATGWMRELGVRHRWLGWGLDRLEMTDAEVSLTGGAVTRRTRWAAGGGEFEITHRQRLRRVGDDVEIDEEVAIPADLDDIPRVGVHLALDGGYESLEWSGLGPGDSYPDRLAAVRWGRWSSTVSDQYVEWVMPQHHGLHLGTEWFELGSPTAAIRIAAPRVFAFSALHHSEAELTAALHTGDLPVAPFAATHVHLDVAHRGLGTAACGPDTAERHRVGGGTHRWSWTLSAASVSSRRPRAVTGRS